MIPDEDTSEAGQSPTAELESVTRGIKVIVDLMFKILDERLRSVSTTFADLMHQRIMAMKSEDAAVQDAWAKQELALVREKLTDLQATLPHELRTQLGREVVSDHQAAIAERIREAIETIIGEAVARIERELPAVAAYRFGQQAVDSILSQPVHRPISDWVVSLHGGQLVMVLAFVLIASLASVVLGLVAWVNSIGPDAPWLLVFGSGLLLVFGAWALWIWFGARAHARPPAASTKP